MAKYIFSSLKAEYQLLFDECIVKQDALPQIESIVKKIIAGRSRYEQVQKSTNVPWYFIGIIHCLECNFNFQLHLHNGDPIKSKTVNVPVGYPKKWVSGMSWEESAIDALRLKSLHKWSDWSIPGILFQLERYNGFGYRNKGVHSPYLWSGSNHYTAGKFIKDKVYSKTAISKQIGVALILKKITERGVF